MNMKLKISFGIVLLIYIGLLLINNTFVGYLSTIVFIIMFILFVYIFKDQPKDIE
jgi:hypothetical protein